MSSSQLKELKLLQEENTLKTYVCRFQFISPYSQRCYRKKLKPCERKNLVLEILSQERTSITVACSIICFTRSMVYYTSCRNEQIIIEKLQELTDKYPTRGFDNYYGKIRS